MRVRDVQPWVDAGVLVPSSQFQWIPGEWVTDALCAQVDPELFHLRDGQSGRAAKKVCDLCEVKAMCLAFAVVVDDPNAVYGGKTPNQRKALTSLTIPGTGKVVTLLSRKASRQDSVDTRDAQVRQLTEQGASATEIQALTGISARNVTESRRRLRAKTSSSEPVPADEAA